MRIPICTGKYHQNGGFSMAMLVYRRVVGKYFLACLNPGSHWENHHHYVIVGAPFLTFGKIHCEPVFGQAQNLPNIWSIWVELLPDLVFSKPGSKAYGLNKMPLFREEVGNDNCTEECDFNNELDLMLNFHCQLGVFSNFASNITGIPMFMWFFHITLKGGKPSYKKACGGVTF